MFICSMVYYCTHTYIEAVRYIFISKICFCASVVQITDDFFFVSLFGMFSEVMFLLITTVLGVSFIYKTCKMSPYVRAYLYPAECH